MDILSFSLAKKGSSKIMDKIISHYYDAVGNIKLLYSKNEAEVGIPTSDELEEVKLIAEGAHKAIAYHSYSDFINDFNTIDKTKYNIGQNILIATDGVPDLWVQSVEDIFSEYVYTSDTTIVSQLNTLGYIQVGYYVVGHLETQKIDLDNYVTFNDHATVSKTGTIKIGNGINITNDGTPFAAVKLLNQYSSSSYAYFIGKGTLENIKEDYVKRALVSLEQDEYSEEEQENVNALIGSVPKSAFVYDENTETLSIIL